jgi:type I restriction enzyme S subunit
VKTGTIHPQITQMDADSEALKKHLRKSAKSADNPGFGVGDGQGVERDSGEDRVMSDWQTKRLGDVLQLNYGKSLSVNNRVEGPIPVYGSNGIVGSHNEAIVDAPGLIVGRKGSAGQVHRSLGPFCPIDTTFYVTAADAPDTDLEFLFYLLRHIDLTRITGDVGVPGLNREMAYMEPVRFPAALPEQKKIAHILSTVQRAIEAQARIIQTTTELKKALMHKLFTEGLRNEPQKQTEIGPVPETWEVVELGDVAKIERGKFSHRPRNEPRFYGGEYPFVQTGDVSNCDGYVRSYRQTLNEDGLAISKIFPAGTILITIAANIGFTGILEFDSACPDSLIGITPNENLHTEFLNYYLTTQQPEMDRLAPKGTQKNINIQFLKPWPVPLPAVEEQTEIAGAFSATDRKIRLATQKRDQLQDLFRTLLHELMTAKKNRVHELELPTGGHAA